MKNRMLSLLLAALLCLSVLPPPTLASEELEEETLTEVYSEEETSAEAEESAEAVEEPAEAEKAAETEEPVETEESGRPEEAEASEEPISEEAGEPAADGTASGACGEGLTWTLSDDGVLTVSGAGAIDDYATEFGVPWKPQRDSIRTVRVEPGVTAIGERAFLYCQNLTGIELPEGLVRIGSYAFSWCKALTEVELPDTVTEIGRDAFYHCESLTDLTVPAGVRSIEQNTFSGCRSLASVKLQDGLENIGPSAFASCALTEIVIPQGVTAIQDGTFSMCGALKKATLPEGLTSIGATAFSSCFGLEELQLPNSLTYIGQYAFQACSRLRGVFFPPMLQKIDLHAFRECKGLAWVALPVTVAVIGNSAFNKCSALKDVYYQGGESDWPAVSIGIYCDDLKNAEIHYNCYEEGYDPFACGDDLMWSFAGGTLTITGSGDMWDWDDAADVPWAKYRSGIKKVELDSRITAIGNHAFSGCGNLTDVQLGDLPGLTRVGVEAFAFCSSLKTVAFGTAFRTLSDRAFLECPALEEVVFFGRTPSLGEGCLNAGSGETMRVYVSGSDDSWLTADLPAASRPIRWARLEQDDTVPQRCFEESKDAWGFKNDAEVFGSRYSILREDYDKLFSHLAEAEHDFIRYFGKKYRLNIYGEPDLKGNVKWTGSCYGMSVLAALIAQGRYSLGSDAGSITRPDKSLISMVNFYHMQQFQNWAQIQLEITASYGVKELVLRLQKLAMTADERNEPFVLKITYPNNGGDAKHAVLGYGMETGRWEHGGIIYDRRILIYDCTYESASDYGSQNCDIYYTFREDGSAIYCLPQYGIVCSSDGKYANGRITGVTSDYNDLDLISYDTGKLNHSAIIGERLVEYHENQRFSVDYGSHIMKVDGVEYSYDDENWQYAFRFSDAEASIAEEAVILLPAADIYTIAGASDLELRITTDRFALTGVADGGGTMIIDTKNGGVTVDPNTAGECYVRLTANDGYTTLSLPMVEVTAAKAGALSACLTPEGVVVTGDDLTDVTVTAGDFIEETELPVSTDREEVLIVTEGGDLAAYVDTDGDGTHETPLGDTPGGKPGDVNSDGGVDRLDWIALARALASGKDVPAPEIGDLDGDGVVTRLDRIALARALAA